MTGATTAQRLQQGDTDARVAVARERLLDIGFTRAEVESMPDGVIESAAAISTCEHCGGLCVGDDDFEGGSIQVQA